MDSKEYKNDEQNFNFIDTNKYFRSTFNDYDFTKSNSLKNMAIKIGGSLGFVTIFIIVLLIWIGLNLLHPFSFDINPYYYVILNVSLAVISFIQGLIINLNQNYKAKLDKIHKHNINKFIHKNIIVKH